MSAISIKVAPMPGSSLEQVFKESHVLAVKLGIPVTFKFNDYGGTMYPHGKGFLLNDKRLGNFDSRTGEVTWKEFERKLGR